MCQCWSGDRIMDYRINVGLQTELEIIIFGVMCGLIRSHILSPTMAISQG